MLIIDEISLDYSAIVAIANALEISEDELLEDYYIELDKMGKEAEILIGSRWGSETIEYLNSYRQES